MKKTAETKKHETIVVKGIVKKAYFGKTKYQEEEKNRIDLFVENFDYSLITAYDDQPEKLTPGWFKKAEGYINLSSSFDIPVQMGTKELTFEEWTSGEFGNHIHNAVVAVKIRQKEGGCYPVAIKVYEDGEPIDHFSDM